MANQIKKGVVSAIIAVLVSAAVIATAADKTVTANLHDAEAEALLKKMSDFMSGLNSLSADLYIFDEQIMGDGFKLSLLRTRSIKIQLPNKLYISGEEALQDQEVFFNGSNLVVYDKNLGMFIDIPIKGDLDTAMDTATGIFGAELPGRDIFSRDAYTPLMDAITESSSLSSVKIGDAICRHLAFRTDEVDLQLWVREDGQPLPCRYTITSKWTLGAPQYTVTFSNWQVNQDLPDSDFSFSAPVGTQKTTIDEFRKAIEQEGKKR